MNISGLFNLHHASIRMGNCVLNFDMQVFSLFIQISTVVLIFSKKWTNYSTCKVQQVSNKLQM